jgi:nickel/cobalt exporter
MTPAIFTALLVSGFGVAFFHAAIPTHWLPFVLAARLHHWSRARTLAITAVAGGAHVGTTALLGVAVTWFGTALNKTIPSWFPGIAGGILFLFGLYYLIWHRHGHIHVHGDHVHHCDSTTEPHCHPEAEITASASSDRAAIGSLFAFLTLSPCEGFLPFYVSGIRYGWTGFGILTAALSVGAILGMVLFTWLTLVGLGRLNLSFLEKFESVIMGILLCAVGLLILVLEY